MKDDLKRQVSEIRRQAADLLAKANALLEKTKELTAPEKGPNIDNGSRTVPLIQ